MSVLFCDRSAVSLPRIGVGGEAEREPGSKQALVTNPCAYRPLIKVGLSRIRSMPSGMRVRIHGGAATIGGSCVEVESRGARLVLDLSVCRLMPGARASRRRSWPVRHLSG